MLSLRRGFHRSAHTEVFNSRSLQGVGQVEFVTCSVTQKEKTCLESLAKLCGSGSDSQSGVCFFLVVCQVSVLLQLGCI